MPLIIPLFINHQGCKNRCIFCNERITGGEDETLLNEESVFRVVNSFLINTKKKGKIEIAVYGGNFTGLSPIEQKRILGLLEPYVRGGIVDGIRISTRPDEIDEEKIHLLAKFKVTTIELGAQSLDDGILQAAGRGHSAEDVYKAVKLLKNNGFLVGLHLMMGLPGENRDIFMDTVKKAAEITPHLVRLHPTIVLENTTLADYYRSGRYEPLTLEEAVSRAAEAVKLFRARNIKVIRLGLQATKILMAPGNIVAGPFHPAFGALVESRILRDEAVNLLSGKMWRGAAATFVIPRKRESSFRGPKNANLKYLQETFELSGVNLVIGEGDEISLLDGQKGLKHGTTSG